MNYLKFLSLMMAIISFLSYLGLKEKNREINVYQQAMLSMVDRVIELESQVVTQPRCIKIAKACDYQMTMFK